VETDVFPSLLKAVCAYFDVAPQDVLGPRRFWKLTEARHLAMYFLHEDYGFSTLQLGKRFNRDHTTVVYAIWKVKVNRLMWGDTSYWHWDLKELRERIAEEIKKPRL
jgi:chromosomal replication initiator protein